MQVIIEASRKKVMGEVAQKTGYAGAKKHDDPEAYDRISTIDEDHPELTQFFDEVRVEVVAALSGWLKQENADPEADEYNLDLEVDWGNGSLIPACNVALHNAFVYGIVSRWYMYTNKEESVAYAGLGEKSLEVLRGMLTKKAFTRRGRLF